MSRLASFFKQLQSDKEYFLQGNTGSHFEERIRVALDKQGFNRIMSDDMPKEAVGSLKTGIKDKHRQDAMANPTEFRRHYITQINGSQDYPDFLVLLEEFVFGVEVKFSATKQNKPVWNSGLPRPNGIYIFGSSKLRDITFFLGGDVVTVEQGVSLHRFFEEMKSFEQKFNSNLVEQKYGFAVYVRKAFQQTKGSNPYAQLGFFDNPDRVKLERSAMAFVSNPPRSNPTKAQA